MDSRTRRALCAWCVVLGTSLAAACSTSADARRATPPQESAGDVSRSASPTTADSLASHTAATETSAPVLPAAADTDGLHLVVSLARRTLYVLDGPDTLRTASVGVGMDSTLSYEDHVWRFRTPRGARRVIGKQTDPKWSPPEWHYVEIANARHLKLARLSPDEPHVLPDSGKIVVRDGDVGLERPGEGFRPFAEGEEIIVDSTLYIPPLGTRQRRVAGELGRYRLDLGDGYLLHGTPYTESIGRPSSHGCIRLGDDDIAWLYRHVPMGTPVVIR